MFKFLFNADGRVSRVNMWLFVLGSMFAYVTAAVADIAFGTVLSNGAGMISGALGLFLLWPSIAVPVKRFHDRGMSGWWLLLPLVVMIGGTFVILVAAFASGAPTMAEPGISRTPDSPGSILLIGFVSLMILAVCAWQFVVLYLLPGEEGANAYGPDPRGGGAKASDWDSPFVAPPKAQKNAETPERVFAFMKPAEPITASAPAEPAPKKTTRRNTLRPDAAEWGFGHRHPSRYRTG